MRFTFDAEANGLYWEADRLWCICTHDMDTGDTKSFHGAGLMNGLDMLWSADEIIGHNIIGYDLALIAKLYPELPHYRGRVVDTLILSQLLQPERRFGHSLGAWGDKLGYAKLDHEEWDKYSPEMLERCKTDVSLNVKVYNALIREAGETLEGVRLW